MVLPGCSLEDAMKRAHDFSAIVAGAPILTSSGPLEVTCSFGIADLSQGSTADELIKMADEALYCAKRAGRNCVRAVPQQATH